MKPQTRLKIALHYTLLTCVNFKNKNIDDIYMMMSRWDMSPGTKPAGTYKPLSALFHETFPNPDTLTAFLVEIDNLYISPGTECSLGNIKEFLMRYYGDNLTDMTAVRLLLEAIVRYETDARDNYCWDSGTTLLDKPAYKSEIGWFLLGPSVRLRKGQLSKEAMYARCDAILGEGDGSNS